jgi:hypothetical protein
MVSTSERMTSHIDRPGGCQLTDCDLAALSRVDVFCHSHEQFMPLRNLSGLFRGVLLLVWAAGICWAFLLAAQVHSAVPVLLAAASVGVAVAALPLRYYPGIWLNVTIGWSIATVVCLVFAAGKAGGSVTLVITAVTVAALAAWLIRLATAAFGYVTDPEQELTLGGVSAVVAVLLSAAVVPAGFVTIAGYLTAVLISPSAEVHHAALITPWWIAGGAGFFAAAVAALQAMGFVLDRDARPIKLPRPPQRLTPPPAPHRRAVSGPRDPFSQLARTLSWFAVQFAHAVNLGLTMLGNALLMLWHVLRVFAVSVLNWLVGWVVCVFLMLTDAVKVLIHAVRIATRIVLIPVTGLVVGAWCMTSFSNSALRYLTTGAPAELMLLLAFGIGGAGSLAAIWMALCGLKLATSGSSALRSATVSAAWLLLVIAAGGWTIGLFGTFGHGPIRVGWATSTATAILLFVGAVAVFRSRARPTHA